jgi:glutamyl-tRNA reductase
VFLYSVDDLSLVVQEGMDSRQVAAAEAEAIVESRVRSFVEWMENREVVPTIRALRDHADRVRRQELEHAQRMLARGEDPCEVMELMARALTNKFLHNPSHALSHASGDERLQLEAMLRRLYQIHHE